MVSQEPASLPDLRQALARTPETLIGLHDGFEERGFQSEGIVAGVAGVRPENAAWFELAEDTNAALMRATVAESSALIRMSALGGERIETEQCLIAATRPFLRYYVAPAT